MSKQFVCIDVYTIKAGDTLYTIAQQYELPVSLLMIVNRITNPYNLRIGQRLCIPGLPGHVQQPTGPQTVPACRGVLYTVTDGDTLYGIAKEYRVSLNSIIEANPCINPYQLRVGTKICVPR